MRYEMRDVRNEMPDLGAGYRFLIIDIGSWCQGGLILKIYKLTQPQSRRDGARLAQHGSAG